jgi:hypothetical protein
MLNISGLKLPMIGDKLVGGNVYFVDSGSGVANDQNNGLHPTNSPLATLDGAVGKCTASNGDFIILLPGHAETVSSTIVIDVAGVSIYGIGNGSNRPNFTQATSGSDNVVEISANNVHIENLMFTGSTTGTNEVFIDVQAVDYVTIKGCIFYQNTKNLDAITIQGPSSDYITIEDCQFIGVAAGADNSILFENITTSTSNLNPIIRNCYFDYRRSGGVDDAAISFSHSSGSTVGILIENCFCMGLVNGDAFVNPKAQAATRTEGLIKNCTIHTADQTDWIETTGQISVIDTYAVEPGKRGGAVQLVSSLMPAATSAY